MQQIREEFLVEYVLNSGEDTVWTQNRAYIELAIERSARRREVAVDDERSHPGSVMPCRDRVIFSKIVGVVNGKASSKRIVIDEWQTIQQCDPRETVRRIYLGKIDGGWRVERRRRNTHWGARADEHYLVSGKEVDRSRTVLDDRRDLLDGQLNE